MAIVIIEKDGVRKGSVLNGRTLIGRWASNGIVINDDNVSRVHAWITRESDGYYISDAQSRNGTRVNGRIIRARHLLGDGDEIGVGPCRMIFRAAAALPEGLPPLRQPGKKPELIFPGPGLLFDCQCGAPLWAPSELSGQVRRCFYCDTKIVIPTRAGETAPLAKEPSTTAEPGPATTVTCSICQWTIETVDTTEKCPDCGLTFHSECWLENLGCSSYGCAQVNALAPKSEIAVSADESAGAVEEPAGPHGVSWEPVFLAASLVAALLGALLFGAPALTVGTAVLIYWVRSREKRRTGLLATTALVSMVGAVAGIAASCWWWLDFWR